MLELRPFAEALAREQERHAVLPAAWLEFRATWRNCACRPSRRSWARAGRFRTSGLPGNCSNSAECPRDDRLCARGAAAKLEPHLRILAVNASTTPSFRNLDDWLDRHADAAALQSAAASAAERFRGELPELAWPGWKCSTGCAPTPRCRLAALLHLHPPLREALPPALDAQAPVRPLLDGLQAAEQVWSLHAQREGRGNAEGLRRLLLAIIRDLRVVLILLSVQLVRMRGAAQLPEPSDARWPSSPPTSTRRSPTGSASGS